MGIIRSLLDRDCFDLIAKAIHPAHGDPFVFGCHLYRGAGGSNGTAVQFFGGCGGRIGGYLFVRYNGCRYSHGSAFSNRKC